MSFFEVRVSYNIVFTTAIALTHAIGHVTLRPVLRAEWPDHGLRSQVVYSKQPKLGLTQEFVVLLVRMRLVVYMFVCLL